MRLLLLSIVATLALAGSAQASITWGLNFSSGPEAGMLTEARSIGVMDVRDEMMTDQSIESNDTHFLNAAQAGVRIMPLVFGWKPLPTDPTAFAAYVGAAVKRYGPGGDFWIAHPELDPALAPRGFELWNEPDYSGFAGGFYPGRYARLVKASAIAARAANPRAKLLTYGGGTVDSGRKWIAGLFSAVPDLGQYIDLIAVHPYSGLSRTPGIRSRFLSHGVDRDFWITELGVNTSESYQDSWVRSTAATIRTWPWMKAFYYFNTEDWCWSPCNGGYGLWRVDGSPKPAVETYRAIVAGG